MMNDYGYYDLEESVQATFTNKVLTELNVNWLATD
jgi:hypothetical protein